MTASSVAPPPAPSLHPPLQQDSAATLLARLQHRSLEVGAAPIVRLFLQRLDLPALFERHLATLPGPAPHLPTSTVLTVLLSNILLSRQPLYGVRQWASGFVPELLGLRDDQVPFLD